MVLTITQQRVEPDILVLKLRGRLAMGNASQEMELQVKELVAKGERKVVLDMADLSYVDSTGVGILAVCHGKLNNAGGELRLAGLVEMVAHILNLTHMDRVLKIYPTVNDATQNFAAAGSGN